MPAGRSIGYTFLARDQFDGVARKVSMSMDRIRGSMDRVDASAKRVSRTTTAQGNIFAGVGRRLAGVAAGIASARTFRHVLQETATVEDAINKVMSLIRDPADQAKYGAKVEEIIRQNQRLGRSAAEVGEALFLQISQMGTSEQAFANFDAGVKLAIGGFAGLEASITGINKTLENFPELAGNAELAANMINAAQRSGSTDVGQLSMALPRVLGIAAGQGVSADETIASVAILSKKLESTSGAATAVKGMILALTQPEKGARDLLGRVGITATPQEMERVGLAAQLRKLNAVLEKRPDLAKRLIPNTEGLAGVAALTEDTIQMIERVAAEAREDYETGLGLQQSFERVQASTSTEMAKSREAMNELSVEIGRNLSPHVRSIAEYLRDANLPNDNLDARAGITPGMTTSEIFRRLRSIGQGGRGASGAWELDPGARPKE